ncbi:Protein 4.1 [Echinococcus granulosus]|uniref:SPRY domain containing protein n=1 Tax=Echinococcus granulosus TaxID=6210 RepID=A0A068X441_ECHGR|nr:Protein 4.1 [Echinococcus granulosus]CDS24776.1 SPRY domain containing protein [Echinococcus granulosus]
MHVYLHYFSYLESLKLSKDLILKPTFPHMNADPRRNQLTLPIPHFLPAYNGPPQLPLATPEDSDLDTSSSVVSARENTFSSNISSTNTVLHVEPPQSRSARSATLSYRRDDEGDSTTQNAALSITFTSSSTAFTTRSRGASLARRSTFPRPRDSTSLGLRTTRIHRITLLDEEALEVPLKKSATGLDLLKAVCQYLGLRDLEFFGLYFFKHPSTDAAGVSTPLSSLSRRTPWQTEGIGHCAIHHRGVSFWLKMDRRIVDQCKKNTQFWFGVRIYPPKPHEDIYDEITRYLLCLQLRKDLLSGRLACSFFTHTLLAAYWAQSELGDWNLHIVDSSPSSEYLTSLCLAAPPLVASCDDADGGGLLEAEERRWSASRTGPPQPPPLVHLTTPFLQQVAFFHRALRGLIPSRADLLFLQTARKLATYGIDFHRIQNSTSSTVHVNLTRRLPKETAIQRSQSLCPRAATRLQSPRSLSPSHRLLKSSSNNSIQVSALNGTCCSSTLPSDNSQQYPYFLGVFHGGIYIYRGRLRLEYHPWSAIVKMAYRRASFRLYLRLTNSEKDGMIRMVRYECGTTALAKRIYRSCVDHHALFRLHRLEGGEKAVSWTSREPFPFPTSTKLRRLHPTTATGSLSPTPSSAAAVVSSPNSVAICTATSLDAGLRPLSEPDVRGPRAEVSPPLDRRNGVILRSAHKLFLRLFHKHSLLPLRRASQPLSTRHLHSPLSDRALAQSMESDEQSTELGVLTLAEGFESTSFSTATAASASPSVPPFYTSSEWNRPPLPGPLWRMSPVDATVGLLFEPTDGLTVSRDWRLAICQEEAEGTPPTEWRGCRATWGVSESPHSSNTVLSFGPRRLFFEVRLNGNEPIRNASLILGEDTQGFAYQTSSILPLLNENTMNEGWFKVASGGEGGKESQSHSGSLIIGGASVDVIGSGQGDVIGCYLDLDVRLAHWTKNGVTAADMTISIARFPSGTVFFPACAIRNSSITFNFGDTPFAYGPMLLTGEHSNSNWLPLGSANLIAEIAGWDSTSPTAASHLPIRLTPNPRSGWHLISSNSPGSILSPDGLCVRALLHSGWQTLRASESIPPLIEVATKNSSHSNSQLPSVYFEVRLLESLSATPGAGVFVGFSTSPSSSYPTTNTTAISSAFPIGSECVSTFGILSEQISNNQTYLVHAGIKRPYGKGLHKGDIIGCTLNLQIGLVFWSVNGECLGYIVQICASHSTISATTTNATGDDVITIPLRRDQRGLPFTPIFCLANTSVEVNFGDGAMPLKHINKHTNCIPLCHYQRLLDGCSLVQNLPSSLQAPHLASQKKGSPPNHRHHSFAHCRVSVNQSGGNGHLSPHASLGVHKSASCLSAPAAATMNLLVPTDILDALTILQSRIPLVPVTTRLWRRDSAEPVPRKPITSPTFAAPWSRANQVLPIVRTHRIAVSTWPPTAGILETDIDNDSALSSAATAMRAIAMNGSLRRSASDNMQRALVRHLCGQSRQNSVSAADQSSSSSLVERRMAQIPLVPTRIVHTRAYTSKPSVLCSPIEHEENKNEAKESIVMTVEVGEETIARRRHVTDPTLPPSTAEDDCYITSPPLAEVV